MKEIKKDLSQVRQWPEPKSDGELVFVVVDCPVSRLFDLLFAAESQFMGEFHKARDHEEVMVEDWTPRLPSNQHHQQEDHKEEEGCSLLQTRQIEYMDNSSGMFVSGGFKVYERQVLQASGGGSQGEATSWVCDSSVHTPSVPYGDVIITHTQYCLAAVTPHQCVLRVSFHVEFKKPTLMKSYVLFGIEVSLKGHFQKLLEILGNYIEGIESADMDVKEAAARKPSGQGSLFTQTQTTGEKVASSSGVSWKSWRPLTLEPSSLGSSVAVGMLALLVGLFSQGLLDIPSSAHQLFSVTLLSLTMQVVVLQLLVPVWVCTVQATRSLRGRLRALFLRARTPPPCVSPPPPEEEEQQQQQPEVFDAVAEELVGPMEREVFENERFQPLRGYGSSFPGHLLPTDRPRWSDRLCNTETVKFQAPSFDKVAPPCFPGWVWLEDWTLDVPPKWVQEHRIDKDGWSYAFDFMFLEFPPKVGSDHVTLSTFVRRRRWVRRCVPASLLNEFAPDGAPVMRSMDSLPEIPAAIARSVHSQADLEELEKVASEGEVGAVGEGVRPEPDMFQSDSSKPHTVAHPLNASIPPPKIWAGYENTTDLYQLDDTNTDDNSSGASVDLPSPPRNLLSIQGWSDP